MELFVFTMALYMTFSYRHFPGRGHVLLTLQSHWLEGWMRFFVVFFIIWDMLLVQHIYIYIHIYKYIYIYI